MNSKLKNEFQESWKRFLETDKRHSASVTTYQIIEWLSSLPIDEEVEDSQRPFNKGFENGRQFERERCAAIFEEMSYETTSAYANEVLLKVASKIRGGK